MKLTLQTCYVLLLANFLCYNNHPANKAPSGNVPTMLPDGGQNVTSWKCGRNFPENKAPAGNVPTTLAFGGKIWSKYDVATWQERNWNSAQCTGGTPMMRGTSRKEEYFLRAVLKCGSRVFFHCPFFARYSFI